MENNINRVPEINFFGISTMTIDELYIEGYITDEDYRSYYLDSTRTFKPTLRQIPEFSGEEINNKATRMLVVQRKNERIHSINMATNLLGL